MFLDAQSLSSDEKMVIAHAQLRHLGPDTGSSWDPAPAAFPRTRVGAILLFLVLASSFSLSLAAPVSRFPNMLPLTLLVALCPLPPCMPMGVCGGVVMGGRPTSCEELVAVTRGTWLRFGVGLFPSVGVCTEIIVAIED